ncbi:DEAD-box ATP-dependent RNA helicase 39 isoform X1 [Citrus clementina]|uniref:DEAD-box ATP-dependent RNA helicase 39 isoform X1 n=1 Tax=Citrus clementina TaxID=85681 RepID=UPI000CED0D96|nr:DEAD-box ATP-dependent RNA helicase 39 isoform X1 [Citrus x clementina]
MKRTGKSLVNLAKVLYSVKQINSSPVIRPLSTKTTTPTEETQQRVPSKPEKDSFILENFKLRKLKGSAKTNNPENKPSPPQPEQQQLSNIASEREKSSGSNAEVVSSFQELGLKAEMIKVDEKMGLFVPSEIQCVGIPAVLNGKSVVLSSGSGSGRTLAYLLPLVQVYSQLDEEHHLQLVGITQMLRRDEALLPMKPMHPRAIVLCTTEESADQGFHMAKFISHCARLDSSMENGGVSSKALEDVSNAPIGMLIATPSEVLQHIEDRNVSCDDIRYVVLDEADTLFDRGFGPEISKILNPLKDSALKSNGQGFQTILVTAAIAEVKTCINSLESFDMLTHATKNKSKMLGEQLSSLMECLERDNAGKVTAMLLEMDQAEVFDLTESQDALKKKVVEAMDSLHLSAPGS